MFRQDEYQRMLVYRVGFQAFIILMAVLLIEYFTSWLFQIYWEDASYAMLFPMLVSSTYFLLRLLSKNMDMMLSYMREHTVCYILSMLFCFIVSLGGFVAVSSQKMNSSSNVLSSAFCYQIAFICIVFIACFMMVQGCKYFFIQRKQRNKAVK